MKLTMLATLSGVLFACCGFGSSTISARAEDINSRYDFRGFKAGNIYKEKYIKDKLGLDCMYLCSGYTKIGDAPVDISLDLQEDGKLDSIFITFKPIYFSSIRDGLIKKFGEPNDKDQYSLQNGYGANFIQESYDWYDKYIKVTAVKYIESDISVLKYEIYKEDDNSVSVENDL